MNEAAKCNGNCFKISPGIEMHPNCDKNCLFLIINVVFGWSIQLNVDFLWNEMNHKYNDSSNIKILMESIWPDRALSRVI